MSQAMPHARNYHEWVFRSFARYLAPGSALEVGSGHGVYARKLAAVVDEVIVSDIDPIAIDRIRHELRDLPRIRYLVMDGVVPSTVGTAVDNVVLVNLLEHVERDEEFLASCHDVLRPGGTLVVFSPAFPLLYSRMDREAGHHRRYTIKSLERALTEGGFEVVHSRLFNAVGFFGWVMNKIVGSGIHSPSTNAQITLYDRAVPVLCHVDRFLPFVGQSVLSIGRRRS